MLIYLIWQTGVSKNQEIGDLCGLTVFGRESAGKYI